MKSVSCFKPGYTSKMFSKIENIPNNLILEQNLMIPCF